VKAGATTLNHIPLRNVAIAFALSLPCANAQASVPAYGFIADPPDLKADTRRAKARIDTAPGRTFRAHDRVAIDAVQIWYAPGSNFRGVEPNEPAAVAHGFTDLLVSRPEPKYAVVKGEGDGILSVRLAITDVHAEKRT
jgi:hypothetical protein